MSREYDLVDLWFDYGDKLPPELCANAIGMAAARGRAKAALDHTIERWAQRVPSHAQVEAVTLAFAAISSTSPMTNDEWKDVDKVASDHPLIYLLTKYTKRARPEPHFSEGFKVVNTVMMPHVVRHFIAPRPSSKAT